MVWPRSEIGWPSVFSHAIVSIYAKIYLPTVVNQPLKYPNGASTYRTNSQWKEAN